MKDLFKALNLTSDTGALITSPYNMQYFSGFSGGDGYVLITREQGYIMVDSRYTGAASEEAAEGFSVHEFSIQRPFSNMLRGFLSDHGIKSLIYEEDFMTVNEHEKIKMLIEGAELMPMAGSINRQRMIKTEEELALIAKAEEIGCKAFDHVLGYIKEGISEAEIAAELEYYMKKQGAARTSFDTIVLCGERTALPHGAPGERKICAGDFVLMDFGCVYKGYCSDMTRTVSVGGVSEDQVKIYETVRQAQQAGLETIRCGITGAEADAAARRVIDEAGYGEYFGHSLGHGVGVQIHELPNLSPSSSIVLEENMVVSCEPGIYIYGVGGVRIEDLVCVKENGIRNLSTSPKELIAL